MKKRLKENLIAYAFCAPAYIIFTIFLFIPIVWVIFLSLKDFSIVTLYSAKFVGLKNYLRLAKDEVFLRSILNTVYFTVLYVPGNTILGLVFALLLNRPFKGRNFFRLALFVPNVISMVVVSIIWSLIFSSSTTGIANRLLLVLHLKPIQWLSDYRYALLAVGIVLIWSGFGYRMLIFLAGLQNIPEELYEAASLDGATKWQVTLKITLPLLRPTTFFVITTSLINSFQVFTPIYIMTGGGPGYSTTTIVNYLYTKGFSEFQMGYASAISVILLLIILVLTFVQRKIGKEDVTF
ncbi:carbohydrate ABC transporter permease [Pseudothermotoga sp. U03pept]|uniref:carbohydrate ABC transporter permease n=1 Tax=Pseudothermotoga sp. U03pept TaxID=3447012 RepID=UPI003F0A0FD9